jgi:hypothetical protein
MAIFLILAMCFSFVQAPSVDLNNYSEKDLFKRAKINMDANNLEDAFAAFTVAFEKRKQKPEKTYSPLFESVSLNLAKMYAERGRTALAGNKLEMCEQQIALAQSRLKPLGLKSPDVASLQQSLVEKIAEFKSRLEKAKSQAAETDFDGALKALHSLDGQDKYVPDLKGAIAQTRQAQIEFLSASAEKSASARNWDEAAGLIQQLQAKDSANAAIKSILAKIDRGRTADSLMALSVKQLSSGNHKEALSTIEKAIGSDPDFNQLQATKAQITSRWIQNLQDRIPGLLSNTSDFYSIKDGFLALETLGRLNPDHPLIKENKESATRMLAGNSLERANQLSQEPSKALAATTYTLFLSTRARSQADFVQEDDLKNAASYFNRKRFSQVVVSVENESSAPESFVNSVRTRAINTVENLGLSDLRVLTKEQYSAAGEADAVFGNLRVDGKPSTVMMTIRIDKYFSDLETAEKQLDSEYLFQTKEVTNPAYEKKRTEQDQFWEEVRKGTKKVKDNERNLVMESQKKELDAIPKTITEPELRKYSYRQITHTRTTQVRLVMSFKDPVNNETITSDEIDYPNKTTKTEIAGVHEKDTHGISNQPLVAPPTKEQALSQAERSVSNDVEQKLPKMLTPFTERFLMEGKQRLAAQQTPQAVEDFLCHWAITKGRIALPEDAALIQEVVKKETAYDLKLFNADFFSLVNPLRPGGK